MIGPNQKEFDELKSKYVWSRVTPAKRRTAREWTEFDKTPEGKAHNADIDRVTEEFYRKVLAALVISPTL